MDIEPREGDVGRIAPGALDYAVHYANERIQFKKPISSFQATQFMIADMGTHIEAARALVYQAATRVDAGLEGAERLSTMAKLYASDVCHEGNHGRRPDHRGTRLYVGLSRGTDDARCQGDADS